MKNGYYLSAYVNISKPGNVYLTGHRHDNCIALWELEDNCVTLVHYWELERLTGLKHQRTAFYDTDQFYRTMEQLLTPYQITMKDIVEIWGVPCLNPDDSYLSKHRFPGYAYHCMSHLSSCLFSDMEKFRTENILAFSIDGGADKAIEEYDQSNSDMSEVDKIEFAGCYSVQGEVVGMDQCSSPACLWGVVSTHYGMEEGSLMALAYASTSEAEFNPENFDFYHSLYNDAPRCRKVIEFLEEIDELDEKDIGTKFNGFDPRFSKKDNRISMAMKIIQRMSERIMKCNIDEAIEKYGINPRETYLALSGGYALNCPCNTYLLDEYGFKGLIAPPCVSDSGMALGIGLYSFYNELGKDFSFALKNAYYGTWEDTEEFLEQGAYREYIESVEAFDPDRAAEDIENGLVVWYNGRSEIGPRALGNRSIIGDPRKVETKDELNRVKQRQWWRPVAPIVMKEELSSWFERDYDSPYMLQAIKVRSEKAKEIEAIIHEDGSSRLQTIDEETGLGILYDVIRSFHKRTGVPIICNTSLNDRGEPIIDRIEEAMNFALRKGIHIIYINGTRLVLKNHQQYPLKHPLKRQVHMPVWTEPAQHEKFVSLVNPDNISFFDFAVCVITDMITGDRITAEQLAVCNEMIQVMKSHELVRKQFIGYVMLAQRLLQTT